MLSNKICALFSIRPIHAVRRAPRRSEHPQALEMPAASPLCVPTTMSTPPRAADVRVAWRGTLSQVWAEANLKKRPGRPLIGEQITLAMALAVNLGFRWWLQRPALDSF
jgi:hypothetical protein